MNKEAVVHIHNGILLSHKKEPFESVLIRWMNLESTIQMEVNQKNKYPILMQNVEPRKMVLMNLFAGQQRRHRTDLWTQRGKETDELRVALLCRIDSQWGFAV